MKWKTRICDIWPDENEIAHTKGKPFDTVEQFHIKKCAEGCVLATRKNIINENDARRCVFRNRNLLVRLLCVCTQPANSVGNVRKWKYYYFRCGLSFEIRILFFCFLFVLQSIRLTVILFVIIVIKSAHLSTYMCHCSRKWSYYVTMRCHAVIWLWSTIAFVEWWLIGELALCSWYVQIKIGHMSAVLRNS